MFVACSRCYYKRNIHCTGTICYYKYLNDLSVFYSLKRIPFQQKLMLKTAWTG